MLGLPYNEAIDMWSLGLLAVEFGTGVPLYPGNQYYDVLKFIIETQGQPPDHVLDSGVYTEDYFTEDNYNYNQQRCTFKTDQQFKYETGYESLDTRYIQLTHLDDLEQVMMFRRGPENGQRLFVSLIKQMLALDANQRITPSQVLRHPFFNPKSSLCIDMSAERSQNPVVCQHPSNLESKRSQKINCSFQNLVEFSQQVFVHTSASPSFSSDEAEIVEGSILGNHYKVEALLGEGGFGIVAKCRDTKTNQAVAIKVNKSRPDILQQAIQEIFILEQLRRLDPDAANIVKWNGFFHDGERVCLKFELLDQCLWDYIRDRNKQGLPISEVRPILGQLTNALSHLGSVGIVHADLKCRNIMVVNRHESPVKVRLIDFGLACPASAVIPGDCVGTIGYSAPEVMLGLPYNETSDMWSLGLVAVELATGVPLYPGNQYYDVLKFIIETQGQPPDHVLDSGVYTEDYFIEDNYKQQRWTFKTEEQYKCSVPGTGHESLETRYIILTRLDDLEQIMKVRRGPENGQRLFVSLIKQMLALDANQRITPSQVLRHPFFDPGLSKSSPCIDMSAERPQNPVVFQHPSNLKCKRSQKINCSFQSLVEFSQQVFVHTSASPSFNSDEAEIVEGSILGNHYKVEALLGEGGFGIVAKCRDTKTNQAVAIKVNKSRPDILQQAIREIFILEQLGRLDPDAANIVQWNGFFLDRERVCLKFELLDQCLWDYIRDPNNRRLPISDVRPILGQLTNALSHLGSVGIVHADLKPGNIMVVNCHESPVKVKLIDFGLACPASAVMPGDRVGTVGYSAPEVMLGLPYNAAIDMWSLGLVAVELGTGVPLYPGNEDYDVLKFIIETQGQPPDHVLDSGVYTEDYFIEDNYNQQRWTFKTDQQFKYETGYESLDTRYIKLKRLDDLEQIMKVRQGPEDGQRLFVSLIKEMLALDAHQRITPSEVLRHPFFSPGLSNRFPCIDNERPYRLNLQHDIFHPGQK